MKVLVSACLLGRNCKYSGGNNMCPAVIDFLKDKDVIEICPEVMGGLKTPRSPAEIVNGVVKNKDGENVDKAFRNGARIALEKALDEGAELAILQPRSPSCGVGQIYDGTFSGKLKNGNGIFAEMLKSHGIKATTSEDYK